MNWMAPISGGVFAWFSDNGVTVLIVIGVISVAFGIAGIFKKDTRSTCLERTLGIFLTTVICGGVGLWVCFIMLYMLTLVTLQAIDMITGHWPW